ncbi:hypothetical protein HFO98_19720 [Rhizobium leguminosarum]|uniref:hypothetical protein n=1 Tax=Rhizobium leguminosarum TaxID=384 RepID=UPI001C97834D|nr:hypothetical protein [Rhizobium leguminosarum]MBY5410651.1 hypothetical protein [Rhizobium leguminosarum]
MNDMADETEARLNAHRRLFVSLVTIIAGDPKFHQALESLAHENETVGDQEEDPGAEPSRAFATQGLANDEIRAILKDAFARALARKRSR